MLKLHKENVAEISLNGRTFGRATFIQLFSEFKFIQYSLEKLLQENSVTIEEEVKIEIAYCLYFFGVEPTAGRSCDGIGQLTIGPAQQSLTGDPAFILLPEAESCIVIASLPQSGAARLSSSRFLHAGSKVLL